MSAPNNALNKETHARILAEKVIPESRLNDALFQENPRAIILAGQPGSGKGRLVDAAMAEFKGDIVPIDPDELRKHHPDADTFRKAHPYTWSGQTHPDASQWADELLDATITSKKNLIFDTTLSNGQWGSELIKDLQARGYEVEVRAIAAHRLESELGVDNRFGQSLDAKGFGRYVPEVARDAIYSKLPGSLDTIHAQNDVPIRIFNREGAELYDSRTSTLQPGAALEEAREARLKDPNITRGLRDGWKEQQTWHRELPETLPQNSKVIPSTAENLLSERSAGNVVDGIERGAKEAVAIDHTTRIHPTRIRAGAALGIAGLALEAYDASDTYRTSSRLRSEGNDTAANSQLVHFGSRAVGGWAGFSLGFAAGAAAGVETGPGLLVTGTIGGLVGTVGGDKIAQWTDDQKIYSQTDRQGNTWKYEPEQPSLGWQRKAPIDASDDNIDNARRGNLRATPALANELNYLSSSVSVEFVLGSPPVQRNPFSQPAEAGDAYSARPSPWMRSTENGQWSRQLVTQEGDEIVSAKYGIEPATAQRAEQLDRGAAQTVLQNAANSPAAIAARYEDNYNRQGWAAYGEIPKAVNDVRTNIDKLVGSDENLYQRNAEGKWISAGMVYNSTASGHLHEELEATRTVLQAKLPPPQAIQMPSVMTEEARMRDSVMGAYNNASVTPSAERLTEAALAVRATWAANGLDPNTTALQLKPDADGHYGPNSPIASLRLEDDGRTYRIVGITSTEEIQRAVREQATQPGQPRTQLKSNSDEMPDNITPDKSAQLNHPGNSHHPFHAVFRQASALVEKEDEKLGRTPDEKSERLALAATALAANSGMTKIDHMVFSVEDKARGIKAGENVIIVQGALNDPSHDRAHMKTEVAINMPIEQSLKQMDVTHQQQNQQAQAMAMAMQRMQTANQDSPVQRMSQLG